MAKAPPGKVTGGEPLKTTLMKALQQSALFFFIYCFVFFPGCTTSEDNSEVPIPYDVAVFPENNSEIWGNQVFAITHDTRTELTISNVYMVMPNGQQQPLITDENSIMIAPGYQTLDLCAECIPHPNVEVVVEFDTSSGLAPIRTNYLINHQPVTTIEGEPDDNGTITLDASPSYDPEGEVLSFTWLLHDTIHEGPILTMGTKELQEHPVLLTVSDGMTAGDDVVTVDAENLKKIYTKEKFVCTDLKIVTAGRSLLNPIEKLGPRPVPGTQLDVDANGKLKRAYTASFVFEVRATIKAGPTVLDEGQDVARSYSFKADNPAFKSDKEGKQRTAADRSKLTPNTTTAPFPDPLPSAGTHPPMCTDGYDHHPLMGSGYINGPNGVEIITTKRKGLANATTMAWIDQPGLWTMKKGWSVKDGMYYKAYFRSWMLKSIPPCEKFFIVEIVIDNNGKVIKNQLTMR